METRSTETPSPRRCPHCGTPVARRAETCLLCGAALRERKQKRFRLPSGDLWLPLLLIVAVVALWLWKPWQVREPQAQTAGAATATVTPTATLPPTATYVLVPTATPLYSPTPPPTPTLPPSQTRHVVKSGETVSTIAKLYGTTVKAILQANGLKPDTIISVNQELIIPLPVANTSTPTPTLTPSPTPFVYTIRTGDNLSAIAKRYGTTVEALMAANNIADATRIRAGTKITIVQPPDYWAVMAYKIYEVQPGDTLIGISAKFDVPIADIKKANGQEANKLRAGQELKIPIGTATPTPSPTLTPTLTPTPGPAYPAPALLAPPDGTAFEGPNAAILLNWASVGILRPDEWYVLRMRRSGVVAQQLPPVWTRATSYRLPAELYMAGLAEPQRFYWQVVVMRQTGEAEDGSPQGEPISPSSGTRSFTWK